MRRWAIFLCLSILTACVARVDPALLDEGSKVSLTQHVYVVTNRTISDVGTVTSGRSNELSYFDVSVSVPETRSPGAIPIAKHTPDATRHFAFTAQERLAGGDRFTRDLWSGLKALPNDQQEIVVYVHGYNNTFSDAAFRIAQLKTDLSLPGEVIAFSWASRASPLGYEHDKDSVLAARGHLVDLLKRLRINGAKRIVLVGHSMGAFLAMEALRTADLREPGFSSRALSGVVLISPDLDVDVFRAQANDLAQLPEPFIIFTSQKDRALRISAKLAGQSTRLGSLSKVGRLEGLPVQIVDVTAFANESGPNHFTAGSSPALLAMLNRGSQFAPEFLRGQPARGGVRPGMSNAVNYPTLYILGPQR